MADERFTSLEGVPLDDLSTLLICSVRYSLGRRTYMPGAVADIVRAQLPRLERHMTDHTRPILIRDIREQERFGYGDPCDERTWQDLLAWLEREESAG